MNGTEHVDDVAITSRLPRRLSGFPRTNVLYTTMEHEKVQIYGGNAAFFSIYLTMDYFLTHRLSKSSQSRQLGMQTHQLSMTTNAKISMSFVCEVWPKNLSESVE